MTFLAALRCDRITAPCVFDGPINGLKFLAYVEQILVPTLLPGDIVILDNLGSHNSPLKKWRRGHAVSAVTATMRRPKSPRPSPSGTAKSSITRISSL